MFGTFLTPISREAQRVLTTVYDMFTRELESARYCYRPLIGCVGRSSTVLEQVPDNVTSANSLTTFRQQLKHTLFQQSFPDIIMWHFLNCNTHSGPSSAWRCYI